MVLLWLLLAGCVFLTPGEATGEAYVDIASTLGVYAVQQETTCPCGWTNKKRIVGGTKTEDNEFPSVAAIVKETKVGRTFVCTGSIITPQHVLTMIHCFRDDNDKQLLAWTQTSVVVGSHDFNKGTLYQVKDGIQHNEYDSKNILNDVVILVLLDKIVFNQNIGPACLPKEGMKLVGKSLTFVGWGITGKPEFSKTLLKADIKVVEPRKCVDFWRSAHRVDPQRQICTQDRGKEPCEGDSGGAGLYFDPTLNKYIQYAAVDYGSTCGKFDPSVQLNVAFYLKWINTAVHRDFPGMNVCTPV